MKKYFTVVIIATDEHAARQLVPGERIGPNIITACSLGDALWLNHKFKELIPANKEDEVCVLEQRHLAAFLPWFAPNCKMPPHQ